MRRQPTFTRADRLESIMTDEVARILSYEVRSPLAQHVKIVASHLSGDLGHLRINYVLVDGGETTPAIEAMLEQTAGFLGRTMRETLQLKKKTVIAFHFDRDFMRAHRVAEILAAETRTAVPDAAEPPTEPTDPE